MSFAYSISLPPSSSLSLSFFLGPEFESQMVPAQMQSNESAFHSGRARSAAEHSNQLPEMQQKTFEENALFHLVHGISFLNFFFLSLSTQKGFTDSRNGAINLILRWNWEIKRQLQTKFFQKMNANLFPIRQGELRPTEMKDFNFLWH